MKDKDVTVTSQRGTETVPLLEEHVVVEKIAQITGRVRVTTHTQTVDQIVEDTLRSVGTRVLRVPIDRILDPEAEVPQIRMEDNCTIVPIIEEVLVVEKRLRLVEEIRIEMTETTEDVAVPFTLRKQQAIVERLPPETHPSEKD